MFLSHKSPDCSAGCITSSAQVASLEGKFFRKEVPSLSAFSHFHVQETTDPGLQTAVLSSSRSHCWQNPPLHCRNLGDSLEGRKILFGLVHPTQGRHLSFCGLRASVPAVLLTSLKHTSSGKSHLITASWVRQKLCYECPEHPLGAAVNLLVSATVFSKGWHWACGVTYIQVFSIVPSAQKVSAPNEIA